MQNKQSDLNTKGNINTNYIFLGIICFLLIIIAYMFGNSNIFLNKNLASEITTSPTPQYETPMPTEAEQEQPKQIYYNNSQQPVATPVPKKVTVTFTDPYVNGTYYCYEDNANNLVTLNSNLAVTLKAFNMC